MTPGRRPTVARYRSERQAKDDRHARRAAGRRWGSLSDATVSESSPVGGATSGSARNGPPRFGLGGLPSLPSALLVLVHPLPSRVPDALVLVGLEAVSLRGSEQRGAR